MAGKFLKVSCNDCPSENTLFNRASTAISCPICGSTLALPAGGKADLVGCSIVEELN